MRNYRKSLRFVFRAKKEGLKTLPGFIRHKVNVGPNIRDERNVVHCISVMAEERAHSSRPDRAKGRQTKKREDG